MSTVGFAPLLLILAAVLLVAWIMTLGVVTFFGLLERLFQPFGFVEGEKEEGRR